MRRKGCLLGEEDLNRDYIGFNLTLAQSIKNISAPELIVLY